MRMQQRVVCTMLVVIVLVLQGLFGPAVVAAYDVSAVRCSAQIGARAMPTDSRESALISHGISNPEGEGAFEIGFDDGNCTDTWSWGVSTNKCEAAQDVSLPGSTPLVVKASGVPDPVPFAWTLQSVMHTHRAGLAAALGNDGRIYAIGGTTRWDEGLSTVEAYSPDCGTWTAMAPMPTARRDLAAATGPDGRIYAIGGSAGGEIVWLDTVEAYNPPTDTWESRASMPTPRSELAAVTYDGKLYVMGGVGGPHFVNLDTVEAYDPATDTWEVRAGMPTARSGLSAALGSDGKIYAIGGVYDRQVGALGVVEAYDPLSDSWETAASMPTPRQWASAVGAPDGRIYVMGGHNSGVLSAVEAYDPTSDTWRPQPSLPVARAFLAAVVTDDGLIHAIGGEIGNPCAVVEAFDPGTHTWSRRGSMPTRRSGFGVATGPDGMIYVAGGIGGEYSQILSATEAYDPGTDTWASMAPMPTARHGPAAALGADGKVYFVGGFRWSEPPEPPVTLATVEAYDPASDTWETRASMPTDRAFLAAVTMIDGRICALGGRRLTPEDPWQWQGLAMLEIYDPLTDTWTTGTPMPEEHEYPLVAAALGADGKIYVTTSHSLFLAYDPATDTWGFPPGPSPVPRWGMASVSDGLGRVYILGGQTYHLEPWNLVEVYDPLSNTWAEENLMPTPRMLFGAARAPDGRLYAFGGGVATVPYVDVYATGTYFCQHVTEIPPAECEALVALYDSTDGDNWGNNDGWLETTTPCTWYGVTCTDGHVDCIWLSENGLTGPIPPDLGSLSSLEELGLDWNALSGSLPPELGELAELRVLDLERNNYLSGPIPPELGNLPKLESLSLGMNRFSGGIPPELGDLATLRHLSLAYNGLSGSIPPELGQLAELRVLDLEGNEGWLCPDCYLSGPIPAQLGNLAKLESLSLGMNRFSGGIPPELGDLTTLRHLRLPFNRLTGSIPPELGNLTSLETLNAEYNELSGSLPRELGNLTNLRELVLAFNRITGSLPPELGNLGSLEHLKLWYNDVTGAIPPELGNLASLRALGLVRNHLSGPIPAELGNLAELWALGLSGNCLTGSIPPELGNLSKLGFFQVNDNALEGEIPVEIANLVNLIPCLIPGAWGTSLGYNKLVSTDSAVQAFLAEKDPDWAETQTVPPGDLHIVGVGSDWVQLAWTPIAYKQDGGYYEVWYAELGGEYIRDGTTASKCASGYVVDDLLTDTHYSFRVRTYTPAHGYDQQNDLWSHFSGELVGESTPTGDDVTTGLGGDVEVTFYDVSQAGITSLTTSSQPPATAPSAFQLLDQYYDIHTTAGYDTGLGVDVTIHYDDSGMTPEEEGTISLLQYEDPPGEWVDCTVTRDIIANTVTGHVSTLSHFGAAINLVAPMVGEVIAPVDPIQVGIPMGAEAEFTDADGDSPYAAAWHWGDETTSPGVVEEADGSGTATGSHTYTTPGVYTIKLTVTDDDGGLGESIFQFVVIYDPEGGFVTGGGWIDSLEGAYTPDPNLTGRATFGFVSKYKKGADVPTGVTEFQFKVADLNFHSDTYQWLVVAGPRAQYKGTGTINGAGDYGFMLTAIDAELTPSTEVDKFRIKIWDKANGDVVVYDNQMGHADDADPATDIGGGSIVIHRAKKSRS